MALRHLAALIIGLACAAPLDMAHAWHEDDGPVTEYSARTLREGEWRVYPTTAVEYGITDDLHVGTMAGAFLILTPNVTAKWTAWRSDQWAAAVSGGLYYTNLKFFGPFPDVGAAITPLGAHLSWQAENLGVHTNLHYMAISALGDVALGGFGGAASSGSISAVRLSPVIEWRRSRSFAWVFELNILLAQFARGGGKVEWQSADGRTTVEIFGDASLDFTTERVNNLSVSGYWSWGSFNLRLGLGFGNYDLPYVGYMLPPEIVPKIPFPEANLYWRF